MGRTTLLWFILPDEAVLLVLVVGGLLVICRLVSVRAVLGVVVLMTMVPVLAPLIEEVFAALPGWLALGLLAVMGFWGLQMVATFVLGRSTAEHMVGTLAADLVRLLVRAALFPFRVVWRWLWR